MNKGKYKIDRGLTLLYIGFGKGKTTAAVGLAVRARGWGERIFLMQFMKEDKWPSGERSILKNIGVVVAVAGEGFVKIRGDHKPFAVHKSAAKKAYDQAYKTVRSPRYDVVILDEIVSAVESKLLSESSVIRLIRAKRPGLHLVLTGHNAFPKLIAASDLVTEMRKIKHPFDQGRLAVKGIDY